MSDFFTPPKVAELLGVSPDKVLFWIHADFDRTRSALAALPAKRLDVVPFSPVVFSFRANPPRVRRVLGTSLADRFNVARDRFFEDRSHKKNHFAECQPGAADLRSCLPRSQQRSMKLHATEQPMQKRIVKAKLGTQHLAYSAQMWRFVRCGIWPHLP